MENINAIGKLLTSIQIHWLGRLEEIYKNTRCNQPVYHFEGHWVLHYLTSIRVYTADVGICLFIPFIQATGRSKRGEASGGKRIHFQGRIGNPTLPWTARVPSIHINNAQHPASQGSKKKRYYNSGRAHQR